MLEGASDSRLLLSKSGPEAAGFFLLYCSAFQDRSNSDCLENDSFGTSVPYVPEIITESISHRQIAVLLPAKWSERNVSRVI